MIVKKSTKTDVILKQGRVIDGNIVDDDGVIVDLVDTILKTYGEDMEFKLTLTRSTSEEIDVEDLEEE